MLWPCQCIACRAPAFARAKCPPNSPPAPPTAQDARKGILFEGFPPVLQLQLKRFEYDFMKDMMVKVRFCFASPDFFFVSVVSSITHGVVPPAQPAFAAP